MTRVNYEGGTALTYRGLNIKSILIKVYFSYIGRMKNAQNGKRTNFIFLDNVAVFEFAYLMGAQEIHSIHPYKITL